MNIRILLRAVAVVIAAAAFVDPPLTRDVRHRHSLTVVTMHAGDVTHAERLGRRLSAEHDLTIHVADPASLAAACPSSGGCIVVSRGDVPPRLTAGATVVGALRVTSENGRRVIRRVDAPLMVHRDAAASLRVTLHRPAPRIDVLDGDVLVGSVEPGDALDVAITWVPLAEGARALRVVAQDDVADVGVIVDGSPVPVFVYEPEPTWAGTFVRRALDDDSRFAVAGRTRVAPPVTVTRGGAGPLSAAAIGDAGAVVVTAPHTLTAADVELFDRFVTRRGGSLILIPDQRPTGAVLRLIPRVAGQERERQPHDAGLLRVREWLTFERSAGTSTLVALGDDAVVVSRAVGRGRVVISGALDAWRFRGATSNFNTFWTALAWEAAVAAGKPLRLNVEPVLAEPGEPRRVEVELQSIDSVPRELSASGVMTCQGERQAVRLWPGGQPGMFEGSVRPAGSDTCQLSVAVNDATATVPLAVRREVQRGPGAEGALEAAVEAHGGIVVETGDGEGELAARASAQLATQWVNQATRPMQSPLWLIPFAACLSSEWWLRRRAGLS
ncbi:MAG TPA: hypothetical protein VMO26_00350 [Vicinamibacterales bacterium]|nr:hypothetical protein [Vicinamibacterales bacterium]